MPTLGSESSVTILFFWKNLKAEIASIQPVFIVQTMKEKWSSRGEGGGQGGERRAEIRTRAVKQSPTLQEVHILVQK